MIRSLPLDGCNPIGQDYAACDDDDQCSDYYDNDDFLSDDYNQEDDGCSSDQSPSESFDRSASNSSLYKVITRESLLAAQRKDLQSVMDLFSIKEKHARTLLIHYQWDVDLLLEFLVEHGKEKLYAKAGLRIMEDENKVADFDSPDHPTTFDCTICYEDVSVNEVTSMDCCHSFCNRCWTQHFVVKIQEGQGRRIKCMAPNCECVCDEVRIRELVRSVDPSLADKFEQFLLDSYIEDNKRVKWCPSVPHCGNAVQTDAELVCEVECDCGVQFCFSCGGDAHSPCSCRMWELWTNNNQDATSNWMTVNTKPCPKCHKLVAKDGGCNLVVCTCEQPFCWLCGGATGREHTWDNISYHSCGRYKEDFNKKSENAKRKLDRYMHYYNRYKAHLDSMKLELEQEKTVMGKVSKLVEKELSMDISWIHKAFFRLVKSRKVLVYSYPFAYYLSGEAKFNDEMNKEEMDLNRILFEDRQQLLEANVERLSRLLEEKFDEFRADGIISLREKVQAVVVSTDNLCRNLYDFIENDLLGPLTKTFERIAPYRSSSLFNSLKGECTKL
ncbi:Probable E3 ubiquitin-protein ligase ARI2 [Linum perenne]